MSDTTHHTLFTNEDSLPTMTSTPSAAAKERKRPTVDNDESTDSHSAYPTFLGDLPWSERSWMYQLTPFRGINYDFRRRLPFLSSDWTTAFYPHNWWTVAQYIPRMYFINLMPAISYIIDMNHRTDGAYGLNEVILASALAAIVFPVFSIQPLTFVGVTGLINLVNYTQYDLVVGYYGLDRMDYLRVQAWSLIWAAGFHFIVSIFNICDFTRFITDMTSQTFGFYVGVVYIQKGIELLLLEFEPLPLNNATGWLSVTIAILFTVSVYLVTAIGRTSFFPFKIRYLVSSFAFAAGCIFWTGFSHFPKNSLQRVPIERLPITKSFFPSIDRSWFIDFWNIEAKWAFVGAPLGFLIMILFYFDHNVSSVMAQARQYPVKRPAGFHWDFFLLGITTLVSGFLGLPAPNGLVPQCPWSTEALSVYEQVEVPINDMEEKPLRGRKGKVYQRHHIINSRVVENRVGHLVVGLLTLGTMTRPLLVVLGTMPRALFAGIFLLVGWSSIEGNIITTRTLAIFKDRHLAEHNDGLLGLKRSKIALFVGIQWLFFAMTIAISQTIAAIGFPVIITLLIPFRYYIVPRWFSPAELRVLDSPTADASVVLASIGQETEAVTGQGQKVARDTGIAGTEWSDEEDSDENDGDNNERNFNNAHNKQAEGNFESDAPGYVIGHDEEEDEDHTDETQVEVIRSTDVIAHMTDLGGGSSGNDGPSLAEPIVSSAAESTAVNDAATTAAQTSSPAKTNKRSKSATQSWWGLGGSKAVERAPSPHTPVTPKPSETPEVIPFESAKLDMNEEETSKTEEKAAPASGATGLKKFFNTKRKEGSGVSEEKTKEALIAIPAVPPTHDAIAEADKQHAIDQHFASHYGAIKVEEPLSTTGTDDMHLPGETPVATAAAVSEEHRPVEGVTAMETGAATAATGVAATEEVSDKHDKGIVEKVEDALGINSTDDDLHSKEAATAVDKGKGKEEAPVNTQGIQTDTSAAAVTTKSPDDDDKKKHEVEAAAAAGAAAAETQRLTEEYKRKEMEARDANLAAKKKKEEDKKKAKEEKQAAKKQAKEDAKKKKEEAVLLKKQKKEKAEADKREAKEQKIRQEKETAEKKRQDAHKEQEVALAAIIASTAAAKKEADEAKKQKEEEEANLQKLQKEKQAMEEENAKKKEEEVAAIAATTTAAKKEAEESQAQKEAELKKLEDEKRALEEENAKKKEEADAAVLLLSNQKAALEGDVAEIQGGKEKILSDFEKQEKERQEEQAKKKAEEEAALVALTNDKGVLQKDIAEIQANKEKELNDLDESRKAKEKEHAEKTKAEEAELAALIATTGTAAKTLSETKEKTDQEIAELEKSKEDKAQEVAELQKKQEALEKEKEAKEKELAKKKETETAALALLIANKKSTEDEIANRKKLEEKEAAERREKEEKDLAEKEKKRQALEAEIAQLEAKARAARLYLAPSKVPKSSLGVLGGQVAGHEKSISTLANDSLVVKSCSAEESSFYQSVLIHQSAVTRKSQLELLSRLRKYLPTYHGTIEVTPETETSEAVTSADEGSLAVILENLTRGYKHANVLDIKLGKQMWDESASEEKKKRMDEAAKSSSSAETGVRLTGWQVWNNEKADYVKVGKTFGKTIKADQLALGLRSFFGVASKEEAAKVSEITKEEVPITNLPEKSIERILQEAVIPAIKDIIDIVKKLEWRVRGGSLLIIFEGEVSELDKISAKTDFETGRGLTETDQLIDTTNPNSTKVALQKTSRLVDVRLIDFAHVSFGKEKGADDGYLSGLETAKQLCEDLSKAIRKGNLRSPESNQSENALKATGGAALIGSITKGLFSREKNEPERTPSTDKDVEKTIAPAPAVKTEKTDATLVGDSKEVEPTSSSTEKKKDVEAEGAGAIAGGTLAALAVEKKTKDSQSKAKSEKEKTPAQTKESKQLPKTPSKTSAKEKSNKGGLMSLFSARLVANDGKKVVAKEEKKEAPKEEQKTAKSSSFEFIGTPHPKKEEKSSADGSALDAAVPAAILEEAKSKGKGKEKEVNDDKLASFWQVKETPTKTEEIITTSPSKSTGPRKLIRHENPRRGAGKAPPAIQFRDPE